MAGDRFGCAPCGASRDILYRPERNDAEKWRTGRAAKLHHPRSHERRVLCGCPQLCTSTYPGGRYDSWTRWQSTDAIRGSDWSVSKVAVQGSAKESEIAPAACYEQRPNLRKRGRCEGLDRQAGRERAGRAAMPHFVFDASDRQHLLVTAPASARLDTKPSELLDKAHSGFGAYKSKEWACRTPSDDRRLRDATCYEYALALRAVLLLA